MIKSIRFMLFLFFCIMISVLLNNKYYAQDNVIKIWPGLAPGTENRENNEKIVGGGVVDVYQPDLTALLPSQPYDKIPAIIVLPGGGYRQVVMKKEGYDIAKWLNDNGIAAFVLKYRLNPDEALQDAQRALSLVRSKSTEYGIDPEKIGVIGFSAGGHLAANLSTHYEKENVEDHIDSVSCKPNFMVLVYGAVGPFINDVDENTPPAFLAHASDDPKVPVMQSVNFFSKLIEHSIPAELHVYEKGGHGFALREVNQPVNDWANSCIKWLGVNGILKMK